jgi:hypothetical protein
MMSEQPPDWVESELDRLVFDYDIAGLDRLIARLDARLAERREHADSSLHLSELLEALLTRHMMMTVDQSRFRETVAAAVAVPEHGTPAVRAQFLREMGLDVARTGMQRASSAGMDMADRLMAAAHEVFMVGLALADEDDSRTRADLYISDLLLFAQRYQYSRDPDDLQRVTAAGHAVLECAEADGPVRASALFHLGWAFTVIGEDNSDPESLDAGIMSMIFLLAEFPGDADLRPHALASLKQALAVRAEYPPPLDAAWPDAANRLAYVLAQASDPEPDLAEIAALAGILTAAHASLTGDRDAIQDALWLLRWARDSLPAQGELSAEVTRWAGLALLYRFRADGDTADLEESVDTLRDWLRTASELGLSSTEHADDLANALVELSQHTSSVALVDEAIRLHTGTLDGLAPDDPTRFLALSNLGLAFRYRFEITGKIEDLQSAAGAGEEAARLAESSPLGPSWGAVVLLNLGTTLRVRFDTTGNLADLDHAIELLRSAVEMSQPGDPGLPMRLSNLGHAFFARFRRHHAFTDVDAAIDVTRQAIALTPLGHPDFARFQANLCADLQERYEEAEHPDPADLTAAREAGAAAVAATHDRHPRRGLYLRNLIGIELLAQRCGESVDLDETLRLARMAADIAEGGDLERADNIGALSNVHAVRGEVAEATDAGRRALELFPVDHPGRAAAARYLAGLLISSSPAEAIPLLREATRTSAAPITIRLGAAADWTRALEITGATASARYTAYREAVELLPLLAWRGSSRADHERLLAEQSGLAAAAAAAAIDADDPGAAIEVLEHSRSVLWGRMLDLRTDLADLRAADPDMADRLDAVRAALDAPSPTAAD